jgi:hypothetical protein
VKVDEHEEEQGVYHEQVNCKEEMKSDEEEEEEHHGEEELEATCSVDTSATATLQDHVVATSTLQ